MKPLQIADLFCGAGGSKQIEVDVRGRLTRKDHER